MSINNKFWYISPSSIPSTSANSVHVVMQCKALLAEGVNLSLFANRTVKTKLTLHESVLQNYGVELPHACFVTFYTRLNKFLNLRIAISALLQICLGAKPAKVLSRNLYYSFIHAVLMRKTLIFETHQVEQGFRKILQRSTMTRPWVKTIIISKKLEEILTVEHGVAPYNVTILPDAAPDGLLPATSSKKYEKLDIISKLPRKNWNSICGYFGQLYEGRGVEIIESMARERPDILFLVFGGGSNDVSRCRDKNQNLKNIFFEGHVTHSKAQELMRCVDFLLMPYQKKVSIGVKNHDTGRWMSPMKMFEYMAAGVPIISSDLPVLREVLTNKHNALLVSASDPKKWCNALDLLSNDSEFANFLGKQAHSDYLENYTWGIRARAILSLLD